MVLLRTRSDRQLVKWLVICGFWMLALILFNSNQLSRVQQNPEISSSIPEVDTYTEKNSIQKFIHPLVLTVPSFEVSPKDIREAYRQSLETWRLLKSSPSKDEKVPAHLRDHFLNVFAEFGKMNEKVALTSQKVLDRLSREVQQNLTAAMNPNRKCENLKYAKCLLNKSCGFGCQVHHLAYCFLVAYNTRRVLLYGDGKWSYSSKGFHHYFQPISSNCTAYGKSLPSGGFWPVADDKTKVLDIPIIDRMHRTFAWMPMAIPDWLAEDLVPIHSNPFAWWLGQIMSFLLRPQPTACDEVFKEKKGINETVDIENGNIRPRTVGIHIRRTDKLINEAAFHSLDEYMHHVEEYFDILDIQYVGEDPIPRRVYIASDDRDVVREAREKYPRYTFQTSNFVSQRLGDKALHTLLNDLHHLSSADFLVCTFSSQVCRLAFELMQTKYRFGEAGSNFRSLDDLFYFGGMQVHQQGVLRDNSDGLIFKRGDVIGTAGNHWNGLSRANVGPDGKPLGKAKASIYPSYKVQELIRVAPMPRYPPSHRYESTERKSCL